MYISIGGSGAFILYYNIPIIIFIKVSFYNSYNNSFIFYYKSLVLKILICLIYSSFNNSNIFNIINPIEKTFDFSKFNKLISKLF